MLEKIKAFDAQNGHLPMKIGGAILGSAIVTAIVFAIVSALEDDEEFEAEFDVAEIAPAIETE